MKMLAMLKVLFLVILSLNSFTLGSFVVTNEFAKLVYENKKMVNVKEFKVFKKNRHDTALNITYETLFQILKSGEGKLEITCYQFRSNEFKKTPISFALDICTLLKTGDYDAFNIYKESNIPHQCPFKPATYHIYDICPSTGSLPVNFPEGRWKLEIKGFALGSPVMTIEWIFNLRNLF